MLIWVQAPIRAADIYGQPNPLVHKNFWPDRSGMTEEIARRRVAEAFDSLWKVLHDEGSAVGL